MITLKGILTDAGGNPIPRGLIELVAKRNAGEALVHAAISERANEEGGYHFTIKSGEYLVYAQVSRQSDVEPLGEATITIDLEGELAIEDIMVMTEPLLPESIIEMRRTLVSVRESQSAIESLSDLVVKSKRSIDESETTVKAAEKAVADNLALSQQAASTSNSAAQIATEESGKAKFDAEKSKASAESASKSKELAKTSEDKAKLSESASKENADKTADDRAVVEEIAQVVNVKHEQVSRDANQVKLDKKSVSDDKGLISSLASDVSSNANASSHALNQVSIKADAIDAKHLDVITRHSEVVVRHEDVLKKAMEVDGNAMFVGGALDSINELAEKTQINKESVDQSLIATQNLAEVATSSANTATKQASEAKEHAQVSSSGAYGALALSISQVRLNIRYHPIF